MTALIVIGSILLFFVFLLSIKVKIIVSYSDEVALTVKALGIKIRILPAKSKKGPHRMSARKAQKIKKKLRDKRLKKNESARKKAAQKEESKLQKTEKPKKSLAEILCGKNGGVMSDARSSIERHASCCIDILYSISVTNKNLSRIDCVTNIDIKHNFCSP